jgi:hypothetical protein
MSPEFDLVCLLLWHSASPTLALLMCAYSWIISTHGVLRLLLPPASSLPTKKIIKSQKLEARTWANPRAYLPYFLFLRDLCTLLLDI